MNDEKKIKVEGNEENLHKIEEQEKEIEYLKKEIEKLSSMINQMTKPSKNVWTACSNNEKYINKKRDDINFCWNTEESHYMVDDEPWYRSYEDNYISDLFQNSESEEVSYDKEQIKCLKKIILDNLK